LAGWRLPMAPTHALPAGAHERDAADAQRQRVANQRQAGHGRGVRSARQQQEYEEGGRRGRQPLLQRRDHRGGDHGAHAAAYRAGEGCAGDAGR
jgi:hypothetical protein